MAGSAHSSPSSIQSVEARQRHAHRARPHRRPQRHAGKRARLGLAVAVVHRDPDPVLPQIHDLGVQRLAGGHGVAQGGQFAQLGALGHHAVLRRGHAQDGDLLALDQVQPLGGVEAGVVQQRGRSAQPRRDERIARRLRPAAGGGAPRQLARARAEPVLGLHLLAGQVALAVADRLGAARGAGCEHDQGGGARVQVGRGGGGAVEQALVGHHQQRAVESRLAHGGGVALVAQHGRRLDRVHARAQVRCAQLLGAGQRHGAHPKARHQRQDPLQRGCR